MHSFVHYTKMVSLLASALVVVALGHLQHPPPPTPPSAVKPLKMLTDPAARCMDGTLSGYYISPSRNVSQTKWVLMLQGGGECVSSKCLAKAASALGSSKYFPKTYAFFGESTSHLSDTSCTGNPVLCEYNQVSLCYSSPYYNPHATLRIHPPSSSLIEKHCLKTVRIPYRSTVRLAQTRRPFSFSCVCIIISNSFRLYRPFVCPLRLLYSYNAPLPRKGLSAVLLARPVERASRGAVCSKLVCAWVLLLGAPYTERRR